MRPGISVEPKSTPSGRDVSAEWWPVWTGRARALLETVVIVGLAGVQLSWEMRLCALAGSTSLIPYRGWTRNRINLRFRLFGHAERPL